MFTFACGKGYFHLVCDVGGIKCCMMFSIPRDLVKTLLPLWSSGKRSFSLVWSSGRGL